MSRFLHIIDIICGVGIGIACALILFQTIVVNTDVFLRYIFTKPILWAQEITEYSILYITFLGTAWVLRRDGHIKVGFVISRFKAGIQTILNIIFNIVGAVIAGMIAWYGTLVTISHAQRGLTSHTLLYVPEAYVLVIIPVGCLLFMLQCLVKIYLELKKARVIKS